MTTLELDRARITLTAARQIIAGPVEIKLPKAAWLAAERSRANIQDALSADVVAYGVNTGFGKLAKTRVDADQLSELQQNLVRSHARAAISSAHAAPAGSIVAKAEKPEIGVRALKTQPVILV